MELPPVKLVVCDMDGTLLDSRHEVSSEFFELFARLRAAGIHFAAASGRQYASIVDKLAGVRDDITVIAENGAVVREGAETLMVTPIGRAEVERTLTAVRGHADIHAVVCTPDEAYTSDRSPRFIGYMREFYASHVAMSDPLDYEGQAVKVALYHAESSERHVYPAVRALEDTLKVKVSGRHWVDVSSPEAHKGRAVRELQQRLGVGPEETMAFGDYLNDLEMLALARHSYAMANAHPQVVAAARHGTASNDEGGVERVLRRLLESR